MLDDLNEVAVIGKRGQKLAMGTPVLGSARLGAAPGGRMRRPFTRPLLPWSFFHRS